MTNVVRHASARRCVISLAIDGSGDLLVEVADDGSGIPPHPRGGVGLPSMRERAAELGGSCSIERSAAGGTRVRAVIPLKRGELGERAEHERVPAAQHL
jgi:signal transduction histidine kinase